jgi:hypothetical protein
MFRTSFALLAAMGVLGCTHSPVDDRPLLESTPASWQAGLAETCGTAKSAESVLKGLKASYAFAFDYDDSRPSTTIVLRLRYAGGAPTCEVAGGAASVSKNGGSSTTLSTQYRLVIPVALDVTTADGAIATETLDAFVRFSTIESPSTRLAATGSWSLVRGTYVKPSGALGIRLDATFVERFEGVVSATTDAPCPTPAPGDAPQGCMPPTPISLGSWGLAKPPPVPASPPTEPQ